MASWAAKLQSVCLVLTLLLALSSWLEGEAHEVPGGVAGLQLPRRSLLQSTKAPLNIRAVNLGGWLVLEEWIQPALFKNINTRDNDLLDGERIRLQSTSSTGGKLPGLYMSAEGGGGSGMSVNRTAASTWETFKIWRVSPGVYNLRVDGNQFVKAVNNGGGIVEATATTPSTWETFTFERNPADNMAIHIKAGNGNYFQARNKNQLTADFTGTTVWGENDHTFKMTILGGGPQGDFQLANAWGPGSGQAKAVFKAHRDTFIQEKDFKWLKDHRINAVRIPVGYWTGYDPNPPAPFVSGSLQALDNAFSWGKTHGIKIIIDIHAAPCSQNGEQHSATRDGVATWAQNSTCRDQTIAAIDILAKRYTQATYNQALLGFELLNEPFKSVTPDVTVLEEYYRKGYATVRKYSPTAYVIMSQVIPASNDETESLANCLPSGSTNSVIDIHLYNLFCDTCYKDKSVQENIDIIYGARQTLITRLNKSKSYVLVGEWTNNWYVKGASNSDFMRFAKAQETVFGQATFGWAHWTIRNVDDHWSYETGVNNGYMPNYPVN